MNDSPEVLDALFIHEDLGLNKKKPLPEDYQTAEKEWNQGHYEQSFASLPTRKRNSLARDQMYHREFHALCDAIVRIPPARNRE